jgi:hypothetical protein
MHVMVEIVIAMVLLYHHRQGWTALSMQGWSSSSPHLANHLLVPPAVIGKWRKRSGNMHTTTNQHKSPRAVGKSGNRLHGRSSLHGVQRGVKNACRKCNAGGVNIFGSVHLGLVRYVLRAEDGVSVVPQNNNCSRGNG